MGCLFAPTCLTQSGIEGSVRSCFEFNLAQYTTAAILVALDIVHMLLTPSALDLMWALDLSSIYYVNAGHCAL